MFFRSLPLYGVIDTVSCGLQFPLVHQEQTAGPWAKTSSNFFEDHLYLAPDTVAIISVCGSLPCFQNDRVYSIFLHIMCSHGLLAEIAIIIIIGAEFR